MKIEFSAPLHRILCDKYGFLVFSSSPSEKERILKSVRGSES